MKLIKKN